MKLVLTLVIILVVGIWFWNNLNSTWLGFYYPEEGDTFNYIKSSKFRSLEECRDWVNEMITSHNPSGYGYDYECGKNCKLSDSGIDIYHCEETKE